MLLGSRLSPYILKQKLPKYPSIGELDLGYTIEKNSRLIVIYRHFQEREIQFSTYEVWDRFSTAVVNYFQNREERKPLLIQLDEGFTAETVVKKGTDNCEHYVLKLVQGSRSFEIYGDVLNVFVESVHKQIEKEFEELKALKPLIEKKINEIFKLFKQTNPKSILECQKIFLNSGMYDCDNPVDSKIMKSGLHVFLKNYKDFEKENVAPLTQATPSKRKR